MTTETKQAINNVVIVGGGGAGWLTVGLIAAEYVGNGHTGVSVTLPATAWFIAAAS